MGRDSRGAREEKGYVQPWLKIVNRSKQKNLKFKKHNEGRLEKATIEFPFTKI